MPVLYKNFIDQNGFVPKIFTLVNEDGDQYVFFLDNLNLEREAEEDLYLYILKAHKAIAYSRGCLTLLASGVQQTYIVVVSRDDPLGVQLVSPIERDESGAVSKICECRIDSVPREKLFHGSWFREKDLTQERIEELSDLWMRIKTKAMYRKMIDFVKN